MESTIILHIGLFLGVVGKVLLGLTVLGVHSHIVKERKIDTYVIQYMKREKTLGILGICFVIFGYLCELIFYL
jgi:hypothetical protein